MLSLVDSDYGGRILDMYMQLYLAEHQPTTLRNAALVGRYDWNSRQIGCRSFPLYYGKL